MHPAEMARQIPTWHLHTRCLAPLPDGRAGVKFAYVSIVYPSEDNFNSVLQACSWRDEHCKPSGLRLVIEVYRLAV